MLLNRLVNFKYFPIIVFLFFLTLMIWVRVEKGGMGNPYWDEGWYVNLIQYGYWVGENTSVQCNITFFPLYPLICYLVHLAAPALPVVKVMLTVSYIFCYISIFFLHKIISFYYNKFVSACSIFIYLCFPFSFFLFQGYTEALWFAEAFGFIYFLKIRQNYLLALIIIGFASCTRIYGCLLLLIYLDDRIRSTPLTIRNVLKLSLSVPIGLSGLLLFCCYQLVKFNDPFVFLKTQDAWGHVLDNSFVTILQLKRIVTIGLKMDLENSYCLTSLMFLLGILVLVNRKRMDSIFLLFNLIFLLFFFYAYNPNCMDSTGRYLILLFPNAIYITIRILGSNATFETCKERLGIFAFICVLLFSINIVLLTKFYAHVFVG